MALEAINLEPYEAVTGPAELPLRVEAVQVEEQPPALVGRPPSLAQMLRQSGKLDDDQIAQTEETARRGGHVRRGLRSLRLLTFAQRDATYEGPSDANPQGYYDAYQ